MAAAAPFMHIGYWVLVADGMCWTDAGIDGLRHSEHVDFCLTCLKSSCRSGHKPHEMTRELIRHH